MKFSIFLISVFIGTQIFAANSKIKDCDTLNKFGICRDGISVMANRASNFLYISGYCSGQLKCSEDSIRECISENSRIEPRELDLIEENHRAFIITEILAINNCVNHSNIQALEDEILKSFSN